MDFAAYQAQVLGLSREYQALGRWYFGSGGTDFFAHLSAFYPHLSADASRDFSSGSSLFLCALRSLASSPCPPSAPRPLGLAPPVSLVSSAFPRAPALPSFPEPPFSAHAPPPPVSSSFYPSGLGASALHPPSMVSSALPGVPSAPHFSSLPLASSLAPPLPPAPHPFTSPSFSVASVGSFGLRALAPVSFAAPAVPVAALAVPDPPPPLFPPFAVSESLVGVASAPSVPASVSLASVSAPVVSSAPHGFASAPGPSTGLPRVFSAPPGASAPLPSAFAFIPDDPFYPGFQDSAAPDPEAPQPPFLPDSVRAEIRRMYQYLVDLFPQAVGSPTAPPPPRVLFEEFFSFASALQQPVYLSWFERVRTALSEADTRLASLLAGGRAESRLLPPRSTQYAVCG